MGKNLQKLFSFRTENEIINKMNFIAEFNSRTRNKEIEHVLKAHISNFESEHGKLIIKEDGTVKIAKPSKVNMDELSITKTG